VSRKKARRYSYKREQCSTVRVLEGPHESCDMHRLCARGWDTYKPEEKEKSRPGEHMRADRREAKIER
jgi:hypothetical protein